jgi:hypothetical protein
MVRSAIPQGFKLKILKSMDFLRLKNVTSIFNLKRSNQVKVIVINIHFYLCGTASDAVDMVRSAIPQGLN